MDRIRSSLSGISKRSSRSAHRHGTERKVNQTNRGSAIFITISTRSFRLRKIAASPPDHDFGRTRSTLLHPSRKFGRPDPKCRTGELGAESGKTQPLWE